MKTKVIMTAIVLMAFMFGLTAKVALACDSECDKLGPNYQNKGEVQPNKL